MRVLIQRVTYAAVAVVGKPNAEIQNGLLVFVGMEDADNDSDVTWASNKIVNLRIFNDENNVPNLSLNDGPHQEANPNVSYIIKI